MLEFGILADEAVLLAAAVVLPASNVHTDASLATSPTPIRFSFGPVGERHFVFFVLYAISPHERGLGMSCYPHFDPVLFSSTASTSDSALTPC